MKTRFDFKDTNERIVYIKAVPVAELPDDIRSELLSDAEDRTEVFAVHNGEGERLALVAERGLAFALARHHDFAPVTVH